ncbi:hypothetical protein ACHAW6_010197 [Cyclotella cf. meneghiniana]
MNSPTYIMIYKHASNEFLSSSNRLRRNGLFPPNRMNSFMRLILLFSLSRQVCCNASVHPMHDNRIVMHNLSHDMRVARFLSEKSRNIDDDDDDDDDDKIIPEKSSQAAGDVGVAFQNTAAQGVENHVSPSEEKEPSSPVESMDVQNSSNFNDSLIHVESNQSSLGLDFVPTQTEQTDSQSLNQQLHGSDNSPTMNSSENKVSLPSPEWPEDDDDDDFIAKKKNGGAQSSSPARDNILAMGNDSSSETESSHNHDGVIDGSENPMPVNDAWGMDHGESAMPVEKSGELKNVSDGETSLSQNEDQQTITSIILERESDSVSIHDAGGNNDDKPPNEGYLGTLGAMGGGDTSPVGFADGTVGAIHNIVPGDSTSVIAYHRNESDQEGEGMRADANNEESPEQVIQGEDTNEATNIEEDNSAGINGVGGLENPPPSEGVTSNEIDATTQICQPAASCVECINLSIDHLRSNTEPCYWIGQCISAQQAMSVANPPSGPYKCAEDGSAVYTGEGWDAALNAIDASNQVPVGGETKSGYPEPSAPIGNQEFYYDDEEEYDMFEMVKSTCSVILLAAVIAMVLLIRKRVMNRLRNDASLDPVMVVQEEVIGCIVELGRYVANIVSGSRGNHSGTSEYRPVSTSPRSDSFERQTLPLSTAADEEWGWGDEDTTPHLELPGVGVDDGREEEELALAIAISLSESTNGVSRTTPVQPNRNSTPKSAAPVKPKPPSSYHSKSKEQKPSSTVPVRPAPTTKTQPPPSKGDSIEDLLGQLNSSGGSVITSFAPKPQNLTTKPPPAPKKQGSSSDDIFASMGLSSFSPKPSTAAAAPRSAPLPSKSLAADNDLDADWGDDDLNDLLDD